MYVYTCLKFFVSDVNLANSFFFSTFHNIMSKVKTIILTLFCTVGLFAVNNGITNSRMYYKFIYGILKLLRGSTVLRAHVYPVVCYRTVELCVISSVISAMYHKCTIYIIIIMLTESDPLMDTLYFTWLIFNIILCDIQRY